MSDPDPVTITPDELVCLDLLGQAWEAFLCLPVEHNHDRPEFMKAIHDAQGLIAIRVARRANPEVWTSSGNIHDSPPALNPAKA